MSLNSIQTTNIIRITDDLQRRVNRLTAQMQGAPISRLRIGTAIITSAKIADLSITTAKIQDGAITNAKINSLSASIVNAGTLDADRIAADSITADKLNVTTLSAITSNFGTLTAGSIDGISITGNPIGTSGGSERIVVSGSALFVVTGGNVRATFQPGGAFVTGAGIGFWEIGTTSESGSFRGVAGVNSGATDFIVGSSNVPLVLIQALGSSAVLVETVSGDVHFNCATFQINGSTKTAIVPTTEGYKALYCVESPDVWFFDLVEGIDKIDPAFLEVTEGPIKTVTNAQGQVMVFRKRTGFATLRFTPKTQEQFLANNTLWHN